MYYLCSMAKKTSTFDYEILVRYMLPKGILDTFEVTKVEEECTGVMDETNTNVDISTPTTLGDGSDGGGSNPSGDNKGDAGQDGSGEDNEL